MVKDEREKVIGKREKVKGWAFPRPSPYVPADIGPAFVGAAF
jgi:hypothetical protein